MEDTSNIIKALTTFPPPRDRDYSERIPPCSPALFYPRKSAKVLV
jgi:hypothetical protein